MSNATELNKLKDFVIKLNRKGDGKSFVWDYFGTLYEIATNAVHDETHVYCKACLEDSKQRPSLKAYKLNVSTGNLAIHLRDVHQKLQRLLSLSSSFRLSFHHYQQPLVQKITKPRRTRR